MCSDACGLGMEGVGLGAIRVLSAGGCVCVWGGGGEAKGGSVRLLLPLHAGLDPGLGI